MANNERLTLRVQPDLPGGREYIRSNPRPRCTSLVTERAT